MVCECVEHQNDAAAYLRGLKRALEIVQTAPLAGGVEGVMWSDHVRALMAGHLEGAMFKKTDWPESMLKNKSDRVAMIPIGMPTTEQQVEREEERQFIAEVERRAGVTREEMLKELLWENDYFRKINDWLRRILGEAP